MITSLKKYSCSSCGAGFTYLDGRPFIRCAFCGTTFQVEREAESGIQVRANIARFTVGRDAHALAALTWLSEGDYTPDDILTSGVFDDARGTFFPLFVFTGSYSGNWSASSGYDRVEEYQEYNSTSKRYETKRRTVTDWRPSAGQFAGGYLILGYAGAPQIVPEGAYALLHNVDNYRGSTFDADLSRDDLGDGALLEFARTEDEVFTSTGIPQLAVLTVADIRSRIPGDRFKDMTNDNAVKRQPTTRAYLPFWMTHYTYAGDSFYVLVSGSDARRVVGRRPEDAKRKEVVRKYFFKGHGSIGVAILAWVVAFNLHTGDWSDGAQGFAIIGPLVLIAGMYGMAVLQRNQLLEASRQRRREVLEECQRRFGVAAGTSSSASPQRRVHLSGSGPRTGARTETAVQRRPNFRIVPGSPTAGPPTTSPLSGTSPATARPTPPAAAAVGSAMGTGAPLAEGRAGGPALGPGKLYLTNGTARGEYNITTNLNASGVAKFGEDSKFWGSSMQLKVQRRGDGWYAVPDPGAPNESLVNGKAIIAARKLADGDVLAVGREAKGIQKLPLIVTLEKP